MSIITKFTLTLLRKRPICSNLQTNRLSHCMKINLSLCSNEYFYNQHSQRHFLTSTRFYFATTSAQQIQQESGAKSIPVKFILPNGSALSAMGGDGDSLLDVVRDQDLELDGYGACEGELACCSCHVILSQADYDRLPNPPCEQEIDMLDLAPDLTDTSRLGCCVRLNHESMKDGLEVRVPESALDARLSPSD